MEASEGHADATSTAAFWWAIGCAEISSEHPLAKVLVDAARAEAGGELVEPSNFENIKGKGVKCTLNGMNMHVGSVESVLEESSWLHKSANADIEAWAGKCR